MRRFGGSHWSASFDEAIVDTAHVACIDATLTNQRRSRGAGRGGSRELEKWIYKRSPEGEATKSAADELVHNIDEEVATIELHSRRDQTTNRRSTERADTITTNIGTADICCALSGSVVSFSDAPSVVHDVAC